MSLKRSKKQTMAMHYGTISRKKAVKLVKVVARPDLVAVPVLSPRANGHHKHNMAHQDAPGTTKTAEVQLQPVLVATPVLAPQLASRDAHGRFLAKQPM